MSAAVSSNTSSLAFAPTQTQSRVDGNTTYRRFPLTHEQLLQIPQTFQNTLTRGPDGRLEFGYVDLETARRRIEQKHKCSTSTSNLTLPLLTAADNHSHHRHYQHSAGANETPFERLTRLTTLAARRAEEHKQARVLRSQTTSLAKSKTSSTATMSSTERAKLFSQKVLTARRRKAEAKARHEAAKDQVGVEVKDSVTHRSLNPQSAVMTHRISQFVRPDAASSGRCLPPGYTGHVQGAIFSLGRTFGSIARDVFNYQDPNAPTKPTYREFFD